MTRRIAQAAASSGPARPDVRAPAPGQRLKGRALVFGLGLILLGACSSGGSGLGGLSFGASRTASSAAAPAPLPASDDPVIAFASRARPGDEDRLTLAGGQPATVRLVRSYNAASGRVCREVAVGAGMAERIRLICGNEAGWSEARPLLRGGGVAPP
jgi:hypothetical protein